MNDNDIIKAVGCCEIKDCHECPYKGYTNCRESVMHGALDLINRQKEEIADLKAKKKICAEVIARQDNEIDKLSKMVDNYESCLRCVEVIRANAIKEFAEKLNERKSFVMETEYDAYVVNLKDVDELVKEMTEDTK